MTKKQSFIPITVALWLKQTLDESKNPREDYISFIERIDSETKNHIFTMIATYDEGKEALRKLPMLPDEEELKNEWLKVLRTSSKQEYQEWLENKQLDLETDRDFMVRTVVAIEAYDDFLEKYKTLFLERLSSEEYGKWLEENILLAGLDLIFEADPFMDSLRRILESGWLRGEDYLLWCEKFNSTNRFAYFNFMKEYKDKASLCFSSFKDELIDREKQVLEKTLLRMLSSESCTAEDYINYLQESSNTTYFAYQNLDQSIYKKEKKKFGFSKYEKQYYPNFSQSKMKFLEQCLEHNKSGKRDIVWQEYANIKINACEEFGSIKLNENKLEQDIRNIAGSMESNDSYIDYKTSSICCVVSSYSAEDIARELYDLIEVKKALKLKNRFYMEFEYKGHQIFFIFKDDEKTMYLTDRQVSVESLARIIWDTVSAPPGTFKNIQEACRDELYRVWASTMERTPSYYYKWLFSISADFYSMIAEFVKQEIGSHKDKIRSEMQQYIDSKDYSAYKKLLLSLSNMEKFAFREIEEELGETKFLDAYYEKIESLPEEEYLAELISGLNYSMLEAYNSYGNQSVGNRSEFIQVYKQFRDDDGLESKLYTRETTVAGRIQQEGMRSYFSHKQGLLCAGANGIIVVPEDYDMANLAREIATVKNLKLIDEQALHFRGSGVSYYLLWGDCSLPISMYYDSYPLEDLVKAIWLNSEKQTLEQAAS